MSETSSSEPATARTWSLRRRAAAQFTWAATAFLFVSGVVLSGLYAWILTGELDEELEEQLDAVRGAYVQGERGEAAFAALVLPLTGPEVETPLAARVALSSGESWGPFGSDELQLALPSDEQPLDQIARAPGGLRSVRTKLADGQILHLALDGAEWMDRVVLFAGSMGAMAAIGSLLSLAFGVGFGRRLGRQLEDVAERVEARGPIADGGPLPEEIRAIATAMESTLGQTRAEVERARVLAAGLAHDLRAPVQSLLTSTQVALQQDRLRPEAGDLLRTHLTQLRDLGRTVDNLVAWGSPRVDGGQVSSGESRDAEARVRLDLGAELDGRLAAEEEEAARRGVFFDSERRGDLELECDPGALLLAIRNLVGNAITWSPSGGQVTLILEGSPRSVTVRVIDEGPGVPPADRERVFQPFVRGAAAPGRRAGYGLGLALVAFAAELHGGRVRILDADGGGACFELELPRS